MSIFVLDGKDMISKEEAYRVIKTTMQFPEWFGANLDALADCLGELPKETSIVFVNTAILLENLGEYAEKILDCFRDLSEECGFQLIEKK
ncbi:MAG: barstar family protein [Clostridiales bacterium]|nr:barstar family protein [Clostridiales bacterium]